ncbi:hypothetical protein PFISCL1PPCAC_21013 [Pristionchus fissidentatus]|uniref:Uncharacterized protein n=1 Tax=Pristionchus fissidentatus TaxID=1538716 RepID=A0AAV5WBU6_9BILA|nr:hypothetical protein PFISCL1PPCAC_21013 [Pristionchus fissidentatus]
MHLLISKCAKMDKGAESTNMMGIVQQEVVLGGYTRLESTVTRDHLLGSVERDIATQPFFNVLFQFVNFYVGVRRLRDALHEKGEQSEVNPFGFSLDRPRRLRNCCSRWTSFRDTPSRTSWKKSGEGSGHLERQSHRALWSRHRE